MHVSICVYVCMHACTCVRECICVGQFNIPLVFLFVFVCVYYDHDRHSESMIMTDTRSVLVVENCVLVTMLN